METWFSGLFLPGRIWYDQPVDAMEDQFNNTLCFAAEPEDGMRKYLFHEIPCPEDGDATLRKRNGRRR